MKQKEKTGGKRGRINDLHFSCIIVYDRVALLLLYDSLFLFFSFFFELSLLFCFFYLPGVIKNWAVRSFAMCVWCSVVLLQCYSIVYNIKRRLLGVRILPLLSRLFASQPRHFPHTSAAGTKRSLLCALSALPLKRKENAGRTPGRS